MEINKTRVIYVDIDETICEIPEPRNYHNAKPIKENIYKINRLYDDGNTIVYWTARGSRTQINWYDLTKKQLDESGVLYHELKMGKPAYDLLIDDKSVNNLLEVRNLKSIF